MTFLDTDVIRVLEEVLPERFGGIPSDYQLVEEEGPDGAPRVRLLVHPRVGPLRSDLVAQTFLAAIGRGSGAERIMSLVWQDAGLLRVERRPPVATETGKVLHLHSTSSSRPAPSSPDGRSGLRRPRPGRRPQAFVARSNSAAAWSSAAFGSALLRTTRSIMRARAPCSSGKCGVRASGRPMAMSCMKTS